MNTKQSRYNTYSQYLVKKYGEKVYKLPINLPVTCPNRDGTKGSGGCIFCAEVGTGFEAQSHHLSVEEQLINNMAIIKPKYKANKFIAYFQNYTNTYLEVETFKQYIQQACVKDIVEVDISTRPDCITHEHMMALKEIEATYNVNIGIELGLQSINANTLKTLNRGHGLADFIHAVEIIKQYGFEICVHLIGNLPFDTEEDFLEAGRMLSVMGIDHVKVHSLYIVDNTVLGEMYKNNELKIISHEEYVERMIKFIKIIHPDMVIQRLLARAPEEETLFCNWSMSWRKIQNMIEKKLSDEEVFQGQEYDFN